MKQTIIENLTKITDSIRLDWIERHGSMQYDFDAKSHLIVAWIAQGAPGNVGSTGKFLASGESFRDCIDKFIRGQIIRVD